MRPFALATSFAAALAAACVRPPQIVAIDRATALEQQAGASFPELEKKLARNAVTPQPVPMTPEQIDALGLTTPPLVDEHDTTEAERVDDLLERHCVGEGMDGLLVETRDACRGGGDADEITKLVDRTNRARVQLWSWMHAQEPNVSSDDLRARWRVKHAAGVTCGAWVQDAAGKWAEKKC